MGKAIKSKIRRYVSLMLTVVLLVSIVPTAFASYDEQFSDFPTGWSRPALEAAVDNGLLVGIDGRIEPKKYLTRAETAAVMVRAFGATTYSDVSAFDDMDPNSWYYTPVASAVRMGVLAGEGITKMAPEDYITREQVFSILARVLALESSNYDALLKFSDGTEVSDWAVTTVIPMIERGYVNGDGTGKINPKSYITREEFAQLMYATIKRYITTPGTYEGENMDGIVVLRCGNVTLNGVNIQGDLVVGDGVAKNEVLLIGTTINGRLLTRGGTMTLTNTTVNYGVVVLNPNGVTYFKNYRSEKPFKGIIEYTPASFFTTGGSGSAGGGSSNKTEYTVTFKLFKDDDKDYDKITVGKNKKIGSQMPTDPDVDGYIFNGWLDEDGEEVTRDTKVSKEMLVIADMIPVVDVTFYEGYGEYAAKIKSVEIALNNEGEGTVSADDIASVISEYSWIGYKKYDYMPESYDDYAGVYRVSPVAWYLYEDTQSGEKALKRFDENVVVTKDTDVYVMYKKVSISAFDTEISAKYNDDARLMDTAKAFMNDAVVQIGFASDINNLMYDKLTNGVLNTLESKNLIDDNKYIKMLHVATPLSTALSEKRIKDCVKKGITDSARLEKWPGISADLINSGNETLIYEAIIGSDAYKDVVGAIMASKDFDITSENIELVKEIYKELCTITFDTVMTETDNKYVKKIVNLIGYKTAKEVFNNGREKYCDNLKDLIDSVAATSNKETVGTAFDLVFDPIVILKNLYGDATDKAVEKLLAAGVYYDENPYLQYLVEGQDVINRLLNKNGAETDEVTAYQLKTVPEYAEYMMELLIALDDALCWYGEELTDEQYEAIYDAVFKKLYDVHDKLDDILNDFYYFDVLPSQVESLLSNVQQINNIFLKIEPQLKNIVEEYLKSSVYTDMVNGTLGDKDKTQNAVDILLGKDDPTFTIDCLYDIFYQYDETMQEKLKLLIDSGKLDTAVDKFKNSSFGKMFGDDAIDDIAKIINKVAENGVDYYLVDTTSDVTIVDKYRLPIGENTVTLTRSFVF